MSTTIPGPAYKILTPRLALRPWQPSDAAQLKAVLDENVEYLGRYLYWALTNPKPLEEHLAWTRTARGRFDLGQDFIYGIFSRDETQIIGSTGLHTRTKDDAREIGYWIRQEAAGQGLATETAMALTRVGIEVEGVHRIEIQCDPENLPSAAVARKCGFTLEATLRDRTRQPDGAYRDTLVWTLLADEYPSSPCAALEIEAYDAAGRRIL